ncbi:hypothetical protein G5I_10105 [Acromyrmex echinatior]|uniref:Uncharacterized protein n=1 Tax=Acromyrmex echinatior TaxID=103372 RepID=F4WW71_ACREC|nr:hypothetical protein G5I_10105 [Acromyrmex echinatior]
MEGDRKVLPTDTVEVAGRRTKETRKEKPKGDDRQVERRRKFISKEMWDDAPDLVLTNLDLENGTVTNGIAHARCQWPVVRGLQRERFLGLGLLRAFTPLTLLTHLPYCTRPMAALVCVPLPTTFRGSDEERRSVCLCQLRPAGTWSRSFTFNRLAMQPPQVLRYSDFET